MNNDKKPNKKKFDWKTAVLYLIMIAVFVGGICALGTMGKKKTVKVDKYYEIVDLFKQDKISEYQLNLSNGKLVYLLRGDKEKKENRYNVPNVSIFLDDIHEYVMQYNIDNPKKEVKADYKAGSNMSVLWSLLPTVLLIAVIAVFYYIMIKRMGGIGGDHRSAMNFSKANVRKHNEEDKKVTFEDVAGADEEKEELSEIVRFLKAPAKFNALGARIPKGVLLVGPPGTGKTLLAKAVAGEANVPFMSISGSDFVELYVGVGASRVRDLFENAKKQAPAIIFIDEIDAVGRHRGAGMGGGHDEREQTLNQMLVEMDGFAANTGVIVIAATNRPDILDPALLRPGRFDRQVTVNYPDMKGREEILKVHARNKPLGPDVDLSVIAKTTAGFTGADLENLLNEAALLAARKDLKAVTMDQIREATIKVVAGTEKKSHKMSDKEKKLTAYHEGGHAVATHFLEGQDPVHQVSIIPRGRAGGYTMSLPSEDRSYHSKNDMKDELVVLLGGRVAEKLVLGDISTGASNDIQRATQIAKSMVTKYGMSDKLGPICFGSDNDEVFLGMQYTQGRDYSEEIAGKIDEEIEAFISEAYKRTEDILNEHMDMLHVVAKALIEREKLERDEFEALMRGEELPPLNVETTQEEKKEEVASEEDVADNGEVVSDSDSVRDKDELSENND